MYGHPKAINATLLIQSPARAHRSSSGQGEHCEKATVCAVAWRGEMLSCAQVVSFTTRTAVDQVDGEGPDWTRAGDFDLPVCTGGAKASQM